MIDKNSGFQSNRVFTVALVVLLLALVGLLVFTLVYAVVSEKDYSSGEVGSEVSVAAVPDAPNAKVPAEPRGVAQGVPVSLVGKWTSKINETVFDVDVTETTIMIKLRNGRSAMLYWYGTFSGTTAMGKTVTSDKIDINKAVLSSATSKNFVVGNDTLTFEVSAMGQTRDVEVHRG